MKKETGEVREKIKGRELRRGIKKREKNKQKSKDEQRCVEKIFIYSGIATAGKDQQQKQFYIYIFI